MDVIEPQKRKSKGGGGGGGKKFHIIISPGARRHTLTAHFQKVASSLASTASVEAINDLVKLFFEDPNDGWYNSEQNTNRMELLPKKDRHIVCMYIYNKIL